ncbi:MAG: selenium metabolism-associated LysR family transcriptional regulator [Defluviitaleaceae bacterium]|nr:selenium metabolism-associated LysR family transcriptional regulator [Defluviitaleaceae bacterium]
MDFRQLEAFVKVVEHGSFSKAAEAIFLSQPSVSTYVSGLEKELGVTLINRSTKEVSPTLAGRIFYSHAKELISLKHTAMQRIKSLSGDTSGEINIIASTVPSQYILPELLARFTALYPRIHFNIRQAGTLETARTIAAQRADIGITGGIELEDKCDFTEIMSEEMIFIAPHSFGFCPRKDYSLEELLYNFQFLSREQGSGTRGTYENHFATQGIDLKQIKTCISFDNTQSIINAVISGLGLAIVSEYAATSYIKIGAVMPLHTKVPLPAHKFYYVLKKNITHSHLIDLFVDFLEEEAAYA